MVSVNPLQAVISICVVIVLSVTHYWCWQRGNSKYQALSLEVTRQHTLFEDQIEAAQDKVTDLSVGLAAAEATIAQLGMRTNEEIIVVTSPDKQCMSPAAGRVLQRAIHTANLRLAQDRSAQSASGSRPADPDPGELRVSERADALWKAAMIEQYSTLRAKHAALSEFVMSLPNVQVE